MGRTRRILSNLVVSCIANLLMGNCFAQASAGNWNSVRAKSSIIVSSSSGGGGGEYLPLAGGTMKGPIAFNFADSVGLDLKGKNIVGVSAITVTRWRIVPDYVFAPDYPLASMESVETFVKENRHLPNIPSEKDVRENGVDLVDLNFRLLEKIEELTLYTLRLNKEMQAQGRMIKALESKAGLNAAEVRAAGAKP